ncbi:MAG TPA: ABC transporter permease [Thermoanaerobaculia bacterium]|nr:ABC transporter permease [Thermoanaerobaculia bacterium]
MSALRDDLRFALRALSKNPGFTLVSVLTLAIGIGAATALFSVVRGVLLLPLPYEDPDRLVLVRTELEKDGVLNTMLSGPEYLDLRQDSPWFAETAAVIEGAFALTGDGAEPWQATAGAASPSLFPLLGVKPFQGRTFNALEEGPGAPKVVIVSYELWRSRYGGDPATLGKTIQVDGVPHEIVGVMPQGFKLSPPDDHFPKKVDLWVPMPMDYAESNRNYRSFRVLARLKPGITVDQARSGVEGLGRRLAAEYPDSYLDRSWGLDLVPLREHLVAKVRTPLWVLLGAVIAVLLIACTNVASLLLARAMARGREFGVRALLGGGRMGLVRLLVVEQLVVAALGGALGLLLASWGIKTLVALNAGRLPRIEEVGLDPVVVGFALAMTLVAALITGTMPALQISRNASTGALKEGGYSQTVGLGRRRFQRALVVVEVALTLLLVVGTVLLARSYRQLLRVDPGFNPQGTLTLRIDPVSARYSHRADRVALFNNLTERIERLPGVTSVGVISHLPFTDAYWSYPVLVEGRPPGPDDNEFVDLRSVTPGYWKAMGATLLAGRNFESTDTLESPHVAIIDETLAKRLFPGENPLGRKVRVKETELVREVVGVVETIKHYGLSVPDKGQIYFAWSQNPRVLAYVVVRTTGDPGRLIAPVRQQILQIDKEQPAFDVMTMEERVEASLGGQQFSLAMFVIASVIALLLAMVGIYGLISYLVAQRTREISLRSALGAQRPQIFNLVLREGFLLTLAGVAIGLVAAVISVRLLASMLYGVATYDPWAFSVAPLALLAVTVLASALPAYRAMRISPSSALRIG